MMHNDDRFLVTIKLLVFLIFFFSYALPVYVYNFNLVIFAARVAHFDHVHFIHAKSNDEHPTMKVPKTATVLNA